MVAFTCARQLSYGLTCGAWNIAPTQLPSQCACCLLTEHKQTKTPRISSISVSHLNDLEPSSVGNINDGNVSLLTIFETFTSSKLIRERVIQGTRGLPKSYTNRETEILHPSFEASDELFSLIHTWDFDAFDFSKNPLSQRAPLAAIASAVLQHPRFNLIEMLQIPMSKLYNFLVDVELAYFDFDYHNSIHACDTVQAVHYMLTELQLQQIANLGPIDILTLIVSAAIHDCGHPGLNNGFHVATGDALATFFHDESVLEHYHAGVGLQLLAKPQNNFLIDIFPVAKSPTVKVNDVRKTIVQMVLATDLAIHGTVMSQFKLLTAPNTSESGAARQASDWGTDGIMTPLKTSVMKMTIKAADVSHPTRKFEIHRKFSEAITNEFFEQGDIERAQGMPISFLCDRRTVSLANAQIGFLNFMIIPFFKEFTNFMDRRVKGCSTLHKILVFNAENNLAVWEKENKHDDADE
jgi:hypothetical protein